MPKKIDLTNIRFGRLIVIHEAEKRGRHIALAKKNMRPK